MSATNETSEMNSSTVEVTQSLLDNQINIDKDEVQRDLKQRKTNKEAIGIINTPLDQDGQNILLEKSGHSALTLTNQLITSLDATTKTVLYTFPQPQAIGIKFSSDNPYLAQQQTQNSHVDTQLIVGNIDVSVENQNMQEDSRTAIENVEQTITNIRPTLDEDCFFDYDILHLNKRNLSKDDNTIMEVDSNNVLQNDNHNPIQGEDNVNDKVPEIEEERNVNIATKEEERMETESNITIEGDEVTETQETRQMSYSEAVGKHKGKRKEVTQRLDNG
ncbi:hypothetical protein C2G38_2177879 [Gigaspora rosea]|uniref:Uncharacterized protein n=1 Tax=Gigaspora rosea TaxID=44941 RepID=A0A397VEQ2_9GLOM|nr:hypothetical protein C2G38_2177879 [Gigaspora rosea]CAG8444267.1 15872_t:CDS:2 [Gigaspora rosea]